LLGKLTGGEKMSAIIVLVFLAIIMGIGISRNKKASTKPNVPLSKIDRKELVLKLN
jgi:hypothetical protein